MILADAEFYGADFSASIDNFNIDNNNNQHHQQAGNNNLNGNHHSSIPVNRMSALKKPPHIDDLFGIKQKDHHRVSSMHSLASSSSPSSENSNSSHLKNNSITTKANAIGAKLKTTSGLRAAISTGSNSIEMDQQQESSNASSSVCNNDVTNVNHNGFLSSLNKVVVRNLNHITSSVASCVDLSSTLSSRSISQDLAYSSHESHDNDRRSRYGNKSRSASGSLPNLRNEQILSASLGNISYGHSNQQENSNQHVHQEETPSGNNNNNTNNDVIVHTPSIFITRLSTIDSFSESVTDSPIEIPQILTKEETCDSENRITASDPSSKNVDSTAEHHKENSNQQVAPSIAPHPPSVLLLQSAKRGLTGSKQLNLDISELFDPSVKTTPGVYVYRIEQLRPVLLSEEDTSSEYYTSSDSSSSGRDSGASSVKSCSSNDSISDSSSQKSSVSSPAISDHDSHSRSDYDDGNSINSKNEDQIASSSNSSSESVHSQDQVESDLLVSDTKVDKSNSNSRNVSSDLSLSNTILSDSKLSTRKAKIPGKFCVADCYIVLHTFTQDESNDSGKLEFNIYSWIGNEAEMDKRFCSAMFAVGLKDWCQANCRVEREAQNEESPEFLALFQDNFELLDDSFAAESGLYITSKKRYPTRLYRIHGKSSIQALLVSPSFSSLKSDAVFLLDVGTDLVQWNGANASLNHKSKCRILAEKIVQSERAGKAKYEEMDEGEETDTLWNIIGHPNSLEEIDEENSHKDKEPVDSSGNQYTPATEQSTALVSATLYKVKDRLESDVNLHVLMTAAVISKTQLTSDCCFILDANEEIFMWIGKNANGTTKNLTTELLMKIVTLQPRPKWVALHKVFDCHEIEIFKLRFKDWHQPDQRKDTFAEAASKLARSIKVDVRALYSRPPEYDVNSFVIEETMAHANQMLQSMSAFVYLHGKFVRLPKNEWGNFHTEDAYIFLCVYQLADLNGEEDDEGTEQGDDYQTTQPASGPNMQISLTPPLPPPTSSCTNEDYVNEQQQDRSSAPGTLRVVNEDQDDDSKVNGVSGNNKKQSSFVLKKSRTSKQDTNKKLSSSSSRLECIAYFWAGSKANKLAFSTFKFKTQYDMQELMMNMYRCPVKFVHLEHGREAVALLAHFDNSIILHKGARERSYQFCYEKYLEQVADGNDSEHEDESDGGQSAVNNDVQEDSHKVDETRLKDSKSTKKSRDNDVSFEWTSKNLHALWPHSVLYHLWNDSRYKTVRAAQIDPKATSLVSRDCFLVVNLRTNKHQQKERSSSFKEDVNNSVSSDQNDYPVEKKQQSHYLWIGKGAAPSEVKSIQDFVPKVLNYFKPAPSSVESYIGATPSTFADEEQEVDREIQQNDIKSHMEQSHNQQQLQMVYESEEPIEFWDCFLDGKQNHCPGNEFYYIRPPRFLRCSCSEGYFIVDEIVHYLQSDLQAETCVILDPGSNKPCYVWVGQSASDVVKKLSRKSVAVWLDNLDDSRVFGNTLDSTNSSQDNVASASLQPSAVASSPLSNINSASTMATPSLHSASPVSSDHTGASSNSSPYSSPVSTTLASSSSPFNTVATSFYTHVMRQMPEIEGDVIWIFQGDEPQEFKALFHGWDDVLTAVIKDPRTVYLESSGVPSLYTTPFA